MNMNDLIKVILFFKFLICDQKSQFGREESSEALGPHEQSPMTALMKKEDLGCHGA